MISLSSRVFTNPFYMLIYNFKTLSFYFFQISFLVDYYIDCFFILNKITRIDLHSRTPSTAMTFSTSSQGSFILLLFTFSQNLNCSCYNYFPILYIPRASLCPRIPLFVDHVIIIPYFADSYQLHFPPVTLDIDPYSNNYIINIEPETPPFILIAPQIENTTNSPTQYASIWRNDAYPSSHDAIARLFLNATYLKNRDQK